MPFPCKCNNLLRTHQIKAPSVRLVLQTIESGAKRELIVHIKRTNAVTQSTFVLKSFQTEYFSFNSWVNTCSWTGLNQDMMTDHTLWHRGVMNRFSLGKRPQGQQEERFRCICSCRAAAPGAERCVCAIRGGGCECSGPRWAAAGGSARRRSGQSFHRTPGERGEKGVKISVSILTLSLLLI